MREVGRLKFQKKKFRSSLLSKLLISSLKLGTTFLFLKKNPPYVCFACISIQLLWIGMCRGGSVRARFRARPWAPSLEISRDFQYLQLILISWRKTWEDDDPPFLLFYYFLPKKPNQPLESHGWDLFLPFKRTSEEVEKDSSLWMLMLPPTDHWRLFTLTIFAYCYICMAPLFPPAAPLSILTISPSPSPSLPCTPMFLSRPTLEAQ